MVNGRWKYDKKILVERGAIITILLLVLSATDNMHIIKGVKATYFQGHTTANINDGSGFNQTIIAAGEHQPIAQHHIVGGSRLEWTRMHFGIRMNKIWN